ncbi:MAG: sulfur carrier protein ThiS [Xanthomonadaceae bacterium]|nr:sulfur carrier protein ThiS [Xanthomonadaceae bacterium]
MIEVTVNGRREPFPASLSVAELLQRMNLTERRVAVEVNGAIVPKSQHPAHRIDGGDQVEIVQAIGGG